MARLEFDLSASTVRVAELERQHKSGRWDLGELTVIRQQLEDWGEALAKLRRGAG